MQENLPEIPTVQEANQFPWASLAKFQWGLIVFLISALIYVLRNDSGAKATDEANQRTFKYMQEGLAYYRDKEQYAAKVKVLEDSLKRVNHKIDSTILPKSKQILQKDGTTTN